MERRLPRVGEIWRGKTRSNSHHYIIITKYLKNKQGGDIVEFEMIERGYQQGTRYATSVINYCDPVSYRNDSGVWIIKE